ncbi:MAG: T9SS type A sorting domain-containing protein [bacterium]|nr:MAG: T9SS type A sorting domain-containing protein [bacterium]
MRSSNTRIFTMKILLLLILFLINLDLNAQVTQMKEININEGLDNGTIHATVDPPFTKNSINKIFDGNHLTEAVVQNSDSVTITLDFETPIKIAKTKLFFWNNGVWKLEAANNVNDLNTRSGSYQLLVNNEQYSFFTWDSLEFDADEAELIRLTAKNLQNNNIYLGEWVLYSSLTLTALKILPEQPRLVVGTSFQLELKVVGDDGKVYPYTLDKPVYWNSDNRPVATVDEFGTISGVSLGTARISASAAALTDTVLASVEIDFESTNAPTLKVKVALVIQDPIIDRTNKRKIHQVRNWMNPLILVNQILEEFSQASDGVVQFQIVESHDDQIVFTRLSGELMTIDTVAYYYSSISRLYGRETEGTLQNLAEVQGLVRFDYNKMIDYYDFDTKRNNGVIDEIWVYAPPFGGMYESQLVGPGAFWYNSPPLAHPGLEKLLSIMGWNYERGVAEAIHSFGHRVESAMVHAYGDRWNVFAENPTPWEIFTRIDKDFPAGAHIGNIHYPPNGVSDYDYSNRRYVKTYADNWKRYPILLDQTRTINCEEWGSTQLGYLKWWLNHMPRFTGVTGSVLNNWWYYVVDYEAAVMLASQLTSVEKKNSIADLIPGDYVLEQNYPNPFNSITHIRFSVPVEQKVTIKIYDLLGREVKVVLDEWKTRGHHEVKLDGTGLASGLYFYWLTAESFNQVRKFLLLK